MSSPKRPVRVVVVADTSSELQRALREATALRQLGAEVVVEYADPPLAPTALGTLFREAPVRLVLPRDPRVPARRRQGAPRNPFTAQRGAAPRARRGRR